MSIYFIERENKKYAFFTNSLDVTKIGNNEEKFLEQYTNGNAEILSLPEMEKLKKLIDNDEKERDCHKINVINSLILHVSNDCNMNCKYCFANGGNYNSSKGFMSYETAKNAIDFFAGKFKEIREIKFFGGEPFLNYKLIQKICSYIDMQYINKGLIKKTLFKVVTNGTIINDDILNLIKDFDLDITVSVDGPPEIHDAARVDNKNMPTYDAIKKNIETLKKATNNEQPRYIEATYNGIHRKKGMTVQDTIKNIANEFQILPEKINLSFIQVEETDKEYSLEKHGDINLSYIKDLRVSSKKNEYYAHQKLNCFLRNFKNHSISSKNICMGGVSWFSVFYNGDIYPCYMLTDRNERFIMRNVNSGQGAFEEKHIFWSNFNRAKENKCADCFAINICPGCMGTNLFQTGNPTVFSPENCYWNKKYLEEILVGIAEGDF